MDKNKQHNSIESNPQLLIQNNLNAGELEQKKNESIENETDKEAVGINDSSENSENDQTVSQITPGSTCEKCQQFKAECERISSFYKEEKDELMNLYDELNDMFDDSQKGEYIVIYFLFSEVDKCKTFF
jgi:hypothetical protein